MGTLPKRQSLCVKGIVQAIRPPHILRQQQQQESMVPAEDMDIVIAATTPDLRPFLEAWRPILQPFHLIIVHDDPSPLLLPPGFLADLYSRDDIIRTLGPDLAPSFSAHACKSFGFLVSTKQYIFTLDCDCAPATDPLGNLINPLERHSINLHQPSTPFFFNTLYDPYRDGTDFVRGYPFSLRQGVPSAVSHGLWLNVPDYDAPTQIVKPRERNRTYVDAILTVPQGTLFPMSSINLAFDRKLIGAAMFFGLGKSAGGGFASSRYDFFDDIWSGLCCKVICDHLGYGIKTGLPYVWRNESGNALDSLHRELRSLQWLEHLIPFFQTLRLPKTAESVEDCYLEIAKQIKEGNLNSVDPHFQRVGTSMERWVSAWRKISH